MMAAVAAKDKLNRAGVRSGVILLEKNEKPGKKLYITGKGRCNVTNACDHDQFFGHVVRNPRFMYSSFYSMDNSMVMDFFEKLGCPLKIERGNRVFPVSDHSSDIIRALSAELKRQHVDVRYHSRVNGLLTDDDERVSGSAGIRGVKLSDESIIKSEHVIVCTGGLSYQSTGSTGDGLSWARSKGLEVTHCQPSLVPLETVNPDSHLAGLSLRNVSLSLYHKKKKLYSDQGEMLFTHRGVSGPLVLSASAFLPSYPWTGDVSLVIDFKPALDAEKLDRRLLREFENAKNKQIHTVCESLLPKSIISDVLEFAGIPADTPVHELTREQRKDLISALKGYELSVSRPEDYSEAVITRGGVNVKEINPKTMECRKIPGLYMAGEMLDVDALTGGYNLQIAWSTGYAAGTACADDIIRMEEEKNV